MWSDEEKLELRKMLSSQGWKILEKIVNDKINMFETQMSVSIHDFNKVREKKYDDLNVTWAMVRGMSLVLKAPYDVLDEEANNNMIDKLNEHRRQEVDKLGR